MGVQRRRRRTRTARNGDPADQHGTGSESGLSDDQNPTGDPSGDQGPSGDQESEHSPSGGRPVGGAAAGLPHEPRPVEPYRPSPQHLAELGGTFALTAAVHDPDEPTPAADRTEPRQPGNPTEPVDPPVRPDAPARSEAEPVEVNPYRLDLDDTTAERGLRGLVGSGTSQVSVTAAMRARDAARPTEADLSEAEADLVIVRRGWIPREDLPRPGRRR